MRSTWTAGLVLITLTVLHGAVCAEDTAQQSRAVILDHAHSFWRVRTIWETEQVLMDDGTIAHAYFKFDRYELARKLTSEKYTVRKVPRVRLPARTSDDWPAPAFDDSTWVRTRGPMFIKSRNRNWKAILMRGRFEVPDPASAGDLALSVTFRGGLGVYLNGEPLTRAFMPDGPVHAATPATPYPDDAYFRPDGYVMTRYDRREYADRWAKRTRRLAEFPIPAAKLKTGVNTLALAIHRPPAPQKMFLTRIKAYPETVYHSTDVPWSRVALISATLSATGGSSVTPNVSRTAGRGLLAWNHGVLRRVWPTDYPDPFSPLAPVRITGCRNGEFAGQVILGYDGPIAGLKATAGELTGPQTLPASAVRVRYPVAGGPEGRWRVPSGAFDALEEAPPAEAPVASESGGAVQPLWITVRVPSDAAAGDYRGQITVSADDLGPLTVPIELHVADWQLGDVKDRIARMDVIQSPESVALAYDVPLWSEAHWQLLDRTFSLLAPLATKTLYITAVRRTHFGNEHAMVHWVRNPNGELDPDLTVVRRYLDLAVRHLGKVPGVILYCWEPTTSMGHAGGTGSPQRVHDRPILISMKRAGGRLRKMKGPAWGSAESRGFWKKLTDGLQSLLAERDMSGSLLFGLVGDNRPTKGGMDDICNGVQNPKWAVHSHYYCVDWQGYEMGMTVALWGIGCRVVDPADGYGYGWKNPHWMVYYPREMSMTASPLVDYRTKLEKWLGARSVSLRHYGKAQGARGLGRIGADFWVVLKDRRGRPAKSLAGRYPETYWGQLNLNYCVPYILGRGRGGPVATVRSEALRENVQEVEARIFIEKALLDEQAKARLGDELERRCRQAIDTRIRMSLHAAGEGNAWFVSSDWQQRTRLLYSLAAAVARRLGS